MLKSTVYIFLGLVSAVIIQPDLAAAGEDDIRLLDRIQERLQERAVRRAQLRAERRSELSAEKTAESQAERLLASQLQKRLEARIAATQEKIIALRATAANDPEKINRLRTLVSQKSADKAAALLHKLKTAQKSRANQKNHLRALQQQYALSIVERDKQFHLIRSGEVIALNISAKGRAAAAELGFTQTRSNKLDAIDIMIDVFTLKTDDGFAETFHQLKMADPDGHYEFNQIYRVSGQALTLPPETAHNSAAQPDKTKSSFTIGVIDTGVFATHASFKHLNLTQQNFGRGKDTIARNHGTAVSAILAQHGAEELLVADIFSGPAGIGDSESIIKALNWLVQSGANVINMSLAGPDNDLLRYVVQAVTAKGHVIVAAVGNEGPNGAARYPASYDHVIGVTAVDQNMAIYEKANQGSAVDISAPGVNIFAPGIADREYFSGTSFAAPFVTAFIARHNDGTKPFDAKSAWQNIIVNTIDLGAKGPDPVFGVGYLTPDKNNPAWNK